MHIICKILDKDNSGKLDKKSIEGLLSRPEEWIKIGETQSDREGPKRRVKEAWGEDTIGKSSKPSKAKELIQRIAVSIKKNNTNIISYFRFYDLQHNNMIECKILEKVINI